MRKTEEELYGELGDQIRHVEKIFASKYPGVCAEVPFALSGDTSALLAFRKTGKRWRLHVLRRRDDRDDGSVQVQNASAVTALHRDTLSVRLAAALLLSDLEKALERAQFARRSDLEHGVALYASFINESTLTCPTNESPTSESLSGSPSNLPASVKTRKRASSLSK